MRVIHCGSSSLISVITVLITAQDSACVFTTGKTRITGPGGNINAQLYFLSLRELPAFIFRNRVHFKQIYLLMLLYNICKYTHYTHILLKIH